MTSRSREGRRAARLPGIWRGPLTPTESVEGPAVPHGAQGRMFVSWRIFSLLIVASPPTVLFVFFGADAFYIRSIGVGGLHYMTKAESVALTGTSNMHVCWSDADEVRMAILRAPT